jgi:circadian clock protein KaiC
MSSEPTASVPDDDLRFMSDGIVELGVAGEHGTLRRTIAVTKLRGSEFAGGHHSLRLTPKGMVVYPRLIPASHERDFTADVVPPGLPALDGMLGGGIERGTITILSGPSGVGKTTLGMQFMKEEVTGVGIRVGAPLSGLRGVQTGTPEWVGRRPDPDPA